MSFAVVQQQHHHHHYCMFRSYQPTNQFGLVNHVDHLDLTLSNDPNLKWEHCDANPCWKIPEADFLGDSSVAKEAVYPL